MRKKKMIPVLHFTKIPGSQDSVNPYHVDRRLHYTAACPKKIVYNKNITQCDLWFPHYRYNGTPVRLDKDTPSVYIVPCNNIHKHNHVNQCQFIFNKHNFILVFQIFIKSMTIQQKIKTHENLFELLRLDGQCFYELAECRDAQIINRPKFFQHQRINKILIYSIYCPVQSELVTTVSIVNTNHNLSPVKRTVTLNYGWNMFYNCAYNSLSFYAPSYSFTSYANNNILGLPTKKKFFKMYIIYANNCVPRLTHLAYANIFKNQLNSLLRPPSFFLPMTLCTQTPPCTLKHLRPDCILHERGCFYCGTIIHWSQNIADW